MCTTTLHAHTVQKSSTTTPKVRAHGSIECKVSMVCMVCMLCMPCTVCLVCTVCMVCVVCMVCMESKCVCYACCVRYVCTTTLQRHMAPNRRQPQPMSTPHTLASTCAATLHSHSAQSVCTGILQRNTAQPHCRGTWHSTDDNLSPCPSNCKLTENAMDNGQRNAT